MADVRSNLLGVRIYGDAFYFDDFEDDEVDTDTFEYSQRSQHLFRCPDSRFLIFNDADDQFDRIDLNAQQEKNSVYKLNLNIYRDSGNPVPTRGRAVILYAVKDAKTFAAVCKNEREVGAEELQEKLDGRIADSQHRAVFYMVLNGAPNKYKLRSCLYPGKVLGFDTSTTNKLILCPDEPDNQIEITMVQ